MSIIGLIVVLILVGIVTSYFSFDIRIKNAIYLLVLLAIVLLLLGYAGLVPGHAGRWCP